MTGGPGPVAESRIGRRAFLLSSVVPAGARELAFGEGSLAGTTALATAGDNATPDRAPASVTPSGAARRSPELEAARAARLDGDYRNAYLAFRLAVRAATDDGERAAATLEAAETLLADDEPDGAVEALDAWIDAWPTHPRQYVARVLRARAIQSSKRPGADAEAVSAWQEVLHVGAVPCADAVRARLASSLAAMGRVEESRRHLEEAWRDVADGESSAAARLLVAEALASADKDPRRTATLALTVLGLVVQVGRLPEEAAAAAWRAAVAALASGDTAGADRLRWRVVGDWPETTVAWQALGELGPTRVPAAIRARIAAANGKWETAREASRWLLANAPTDADAGAARAWRGLAAHWVGEAGAGELLDAGGTAAAGPRWGARALWEAAERRLTAGDAAGALDRYARLAATFPGTAQAVQSLYRMGRLLPEMGDPARATQAMNLAADTGPLAFQSVRARQVLRRPVLRAPASAGAFAAAGAITAAEWSEWGAWLTARRLDAGSIPGDPDAPASFKRGVKVAVDRLDALLACGLLDEAEDSAREVCALADFGPGTIARVAHRVRLGGHPSFAMSLGHRLLRVLDELGESSTLALPAVARKLAFPLEYARLVGASAAREGIDPYLLLALMKQESWLAPRAISVAGARGLTQFIRKTAEDVSRDLAWPNWTWDHMFRPYVAVPFGARYLSTLLREFGGDSLRATAAYNAGPGSARQWGRAGGDADAFVDGITYRETREYVASVATYAEAYRDTYGASS